MCWYCPIGYGQGMSDMLAPILYVIGNEVDAFWCFVGLMEQMVGVIWFTRYHGMYCVADG